MSRPPASLRALAVARGDEPADLLVTGGRILSPITKEWISTDLAIADGVVAGWGKREAHETIDLGGAAVVAGFVDAHMHLESTKLWVDEFVKGALPCGTTAVACDPHEIANVCGLEGVAAVAEAAEKMPFTFGIAASSCVPASPFESPGAAFSPADVRYIIDEFNAIGVGEVMNYPAVINGDPTFREIIAAAGWRSVDGHAPGLRGPQLDAYLAAGVESDHEPFEPDEAHEKRQKGMWVFLRYGSTCRDLVELLPTVLNHGTTRAAMCTDDREPNQIRTIGHINHCIRLAVEAGLSEIDALVLASYNAADFHNFFHLGQLGPGYQADLVVFDTLADFRPSAVYQKGRLVARDGAIVPGVVPVSPAPALFRDRINMHHVPTAQELTIDHPSSGRAVAIGVTEGTVRTHRVEVNVDDSNTDLARIAVIERHKKTGRIGLGYVHGFGLERGAIASSVCHDAHNIMVVGARDASGPADMSAAVQRLTEIGGGQVLVHNGKVLAEVPLPVAGLMSDQSLETVADQLDNMEHVSHQFGIRIAAPFMLLSFLGLSVIPELRITDLGLIDVDKWSPIPVAL
ncbi:MAG: adenine deaminase [Ilumatobacteraceae bacterium]